MVILEFSIVGNGHYLLSSVGLEVYLREAIAIRIYKLFRSLGSLQLTVIGGSPCSTVSVLRDFVITIFWLMVLTYCLIFTRLSLNVHFTMKTADCRTTRERWLYSQPTLSPCVLPPPSLPHRRPLACLLSVKLLQSADPRGQGHSSGKSQSLTHTHTRVNTVTLALAQFILTQLSTCRPAVNVSTRFVYRKVKPGSHVMGIWNYF